MKWNIILTSILFSLNVFAEDLNCAHIEGAELMLDCAIRQAAIEARKPIVFPEDIKCIKSIANQVVCSAGHCHLSFIGVSKTEDKEIEFSQILLKPKEDLDTMSTAWEVRRLAILITAPVSVPIIFFNGLFSQHATIEENYSELRRRVPPCEGVQLNEPTGMWGS